MRKEASGGNREKGCIKFILPILLLLSPVFSLVIGFGILFSIHLTSTQTKRERTMAENEKRDNEKQGDGFTPIWNFRTNNPLDRKQPFYSFNEAKDIPLHQIFREFIWWCDENDPVYQKIERQYRYHMIREQNNKSNPSTEPQYTAVNYSATSSRASCFIHRCDHVS